MQNLNYNPQSINNYIQSAAPQPNYTLTGSINFDEYLQPAQDSSRLATPGEILARRQSQGGDLYAPLQQQLGVGENPYSRYGINYDINGDGKVGIFEGMTLGGLGHNLLSSARELGTGLTYLGTHPKEVAQMAYNYLGEIGVKSGGNPLKNLGYMATDFTDAILYPYALDSEARNRNLGNIVGALLAGDIQGAKNYAQAGMSEMTHRVYEDPLSGTLDFGVPIGGIALKGVTKGGKAATKAQSAIAQKTAKISQNTEKIREAGQKVIKGRSSQDVARAVEAAETGNWTGIDPKLKTAIKEYSDVVSDTMKTHSPVTYVDSEEMAIIQKLARDNNITYQAAERQARPLLDEVKRVRQEGGGFTVRYVPNKGLANDVRKIATIEDIPSESIRFEETIKSTSPMMEQTSEVLSGFRKILSPDEMLALKTATGDEVYDYIKSSRNLDDRGLSDTLYNAGVKGIDGNRYKTFNTERLGGYDTVNDIIRLSPKADDATVLRKWAHKELNDIRKGVVAGDNAAIQEANELRRVLGLAEDAPITNQILEDVSDAVSNFVRKNELPEGALGEYIGKRYGTVEEVPSRLNKSDVGLKYLDNLAKEESDSLVTQVYNAAKLFRNGDIFPITHGLAEVDKTAGVDELGRIMAGRFSIRAFGNATYEAIAKEIANPDDYINQLTKNYLDESVRDILRTGGAGDISIAPTDPLKARYISKELLEDTNKPVKQILESATSQPLRPDDIALDKDFLNAFKDQYILQQTNNPFGRTPLGDLYNLRKSTALASGGYLVGNLQTGLANAIMNSNIGLIDDVINATLTKGKLAKNLGIYRRDAFRNTNVTKVGRALQEVNLRTGGYLLSKADSKMQNMFAELAAHAELRRKGISSSQRINAIKDMEASKLGELINDVKLVSLINPTKTIAPSWLHGVGGVFNPFWRWVDTAAQSSLYMLNKHPILANAVLFDVLAKSGYDKEMQNRLGINVELDKPFVSYKVNPKTGEAREMSMEYLPQMNTLKFSSELVDAIKGKGNISDVVQTSIPLIGTTLLAMKGLNKYGKPMYRDSNSMYDSISIVNGKRYRLNPETGMPEADGGHLDEVVSALANETLGSISLFNRTLAPSVAWGASKLTGRDYDYYMPYGQALFGSIAPRGQAPTDRISFLVAGDPTRPRGDQEISNMLRGIYESPYYPTPKLEQGIYNQGFLKNFYKGLNRRDMREMNVLMNR